MPLQGFSRDVSPCPEISDLLKAIDCLILVSVAKLQDYVKVRTVKESSN